MLVYPLASPLADRHQERTIGHASVGATQLDLRLGGLQPLMDAIVFIVDRDDAVAVELFARSGARARRCLTVPVEIGPGVQRED